MTTKEIINVKQYVTDSSGEKKAVIIDIEDFNRLEEILSLIPQPEEWLYKNPEALKSVHRGLKDASGGKVSKFDPVAL